MGWKRRGLRVSSEALLCLGVATIVASFVIDVNADGSKPNIWILIGGVIMLMAAAIGWSLTFCLIWETIQSDNIGSSQNPKAPIHSIQVVVPETDVNSKLDPIYLAASGGHLKPEIGNFTSKKAGKQKTTSKESKDKREKRNSGSRYSSETRKSKDSKTEIKRSGGKRDKKSKNSNSSKTSSSHTKTGRSSDYSRSTGTTGTTSSTYTGTTSSSQDSGSYTSSEQRKSYV